MPSTLETVTWGSEALTFLEQFNKINREKTSIVYMRHSKADYSKFESPRDGVLTEEGKQTSLEFGERLPKNYAYRIHHSEYPRARITAENINQGIINQGAESKIVDTAPYLIFSKSNEEKIAHYFNIHGTDFIPNWISRRYPPEYVESSFELAIESAKKVINNQTKVKSGTIELYISHDVIILPIMFHWFGVYHPHSWGGYLDGFILQLYEDKMVFIDKEGEHRVDYPYWWTFI